jgi:Bardet-Biedl syndrome 1 protein
MVLKSGALEVKILSRNSTQLNIAPALNGPPPEQEIPLKVPKKTKL